VSELLSLYFARHYRLVPMPTGRKRAIIKGWPELEFGPADFSNDANIAIRGGDCPLGWSMLISIARKRLSWRRSTCQRLARSSAASRPQKAIGFTLRTVRTLRSPTIQLLRIRCSSWRAEGRNGGAQISLGPPSIADGEAREWHGDVIEPAAFGARALQIYAARRAIGCLTMRVTPVAGAWEEVTP